MTRQEALQLIRSKSQHERLKAARFFARNAEACDLAMLRLASQREAVSYVRDCLRRAIARIAISDRRGGRDIDDEADVPADTRRQIRAEAVDWVATLLLHEISPCVGLVANSASQEVANYADSRTKHHLDRLRGILEGVTQLKSAAASPSRVEFDLSALVAEVVLAETSGKAVEVIPHGPRPMNINSDRSLLQHALYNGLRNSVEATLECSPEDRQRIVVSWGETDVDYWLTILDRGPGVPANTERAFDVGKTTKKGHSGFGLAIARQAMDTLGGSVNLQPANGGGTRYELRWER